MRMAYMIMSGCSLIIIFKWRFSRSKMIFKVGRGRKRERHIENQHHPLHTSFSWWLDDDHGSSQPTEQNKHHPEEFDVSSRKRNPSSGIIASHHAYLTSLGLVWVGGGRDIQIWWGAEERSISKVKSRIRCCWRLWSTHTNAWWDFWCLMLFGRVMFWFQGLWSSLMIMTMIRAVY